jgi:tetratricopeptide (TPR) repeat protein
MGQAIALSNLGEVAHARGAYHKALDCYQEALSIARDIQHQRTIVACLNNLGDTACALGDYAGAQACLAEALEIATQTRVVAMQLKVLVNLAVLFAKQDRRDQAAALLGLAVHHPASHRETQEKAERLLDEMELTLQDGAPRSSDVVVAEVLEEISSGGAQSPPAGHITSCSMSRSSRTM